MLAHPRHSFLPVYCTSMSEKIIAILVGLIASGGYHTPPPLHPRPARLPPHLNRLPRRCCEDEPAPLPHLHLHRFLAVVLRACLRRHEARRDVELGPTLQRNLPPLPSRRRSGSRRCLPLVRCLPLEEPNPHRRSLTIQATAGPESAHFTLCRACP